MGGGDLRELAAAFYAIKWRRSREYSPFDIAASVRILKESNPRSSVEHVAREVAARRGKVREPKRRCGFPDKREIHAWNC